MWIDSHCHLNHERIAEGDTPASIIQRAKTASVDGLLTICCEISNDLNGLLDITASHDTVWCSIGTHPHDAKLEAEKAISDTQIIQLIDKHRKIIGIGETGLDFYYNHSTQEEQENSFRKHIRAAKVTGLPLIIHTRDAEEDTMRILRDEGACDGKTKVLMHCFSSNQWLAQQSIDEGFYLSFSGMLTFKKNKELQDIARSVPLNRLLVETDAPFLAPEPHRGKTNEPAYVRYTGQFMADLFNLREEEMAKQTTENFFNLFETATSILS